jgi:hypothetical protein
MMYMYLIMLYPINNLNLNCLPVACLWSVVLSGTLLKLRLNCFKIIYAVHLKFANLRRYSVGLPNFEIWITQHCDYDVHVLYPIHDLNLNL